MEGSRNALKMCIALLLKTDAVDREDARHRSILPSDCDASCIKVQTHPVSIGFLCVTRSSGKQTDVPSRVASQKQAELV